MKTDFFQSCGHYWVFQICWQIECSTFTASSFRTWNSSTGILSPPLALFVVMLSKAHLTSHSRMSGSRSVITHCDYLGREDLFCTVLLCILAILVGTFISNFSLSRFLIIWLSIKSNSCFSNFQSYFQSNKMSLISLLEHGSFLFF